MKAKLLVAVAFCLAAVGCTTGDVYHNETIIQGVTLFNDVIEVQGNEWRESGQKGNPGYYLYREFKFPEITASVVKNGAVLVYLIDGENRYNILPYVHPLENDINNLVMQNFRYEVEPGILTLVVEAQDFWDYIPMNSNYKFKVCIIKP